MMSAFVKMCTHSKKLNLQNTIIHPSYFKHLCTTYKMILPMTLKTVHVVTQRMQHTIITHVKWTQGETSRSNMDTI